MIRLLATLLILSSALVLSACGLLTSEPPPAPAPDEIVNEVNQDVRQRIAVAMSRVAEENFGFSIQEDKVAFLSRDDLTVATAVVSDFETVTLGGSQRSATLGLAYITLPEEARIKQVTGERTTLPRKFYAVQVRVLANEAHFINRDQQSAAITQLQRAETSPSSRPQIEAAGCKVRLRYVQKPEARQEPSIRAKVLLNWCAEQFG